MKKASKILSASLALAMAFALAVPALAADAPHDVDPYTYTAAWADYGDRLVSDSKLTINGVIGTELSGPDQFDDSVIFDVVVGGGYTLDMSYPAGRSRSYNTYLDMVLVNGEPAEDAAAGRLQQAAGWFDSSKPQSQYVLTCTEDMVSTPGTERLYHFWLDWSDGPVSSDYSETDGNINFWLRVHPASGTPTQPGASTAAPGTPAASNGVKPAPGAAVALTDGTNAFLYTVKAGDTLSGIASYYYGNANVYKLIYEINKSILPNANTIYAGQTIVLPSYAAAAAVK